MQPAEEGVSAAVIREVSPGRTIVPRFLIRFEEAARWSSQPNPALLTAFALGNVVDVDVVDRVEAIMRPVVPNVRVVTQDQAVRKVRSQWILEADRDGDRQVAIEAVDVVDIAHLIAADGGEAPFLGGVFGCRGQRRG